MKRWVLIVAIFSLAVVAFDVGQAGAGSISRSTHSTPSPGYWLITGYGTSYAYNAPYLGSPDSNGAEFCVNFVDRADPPYGCVGISTHCV